MKNWVNRNKKQTNFETFSSVLSIHTRYSLTFVAFNVLLYVKILATPFKINLMLLPFHAHLSNHFSYNFFFVFCYFPRSWKIFSSVFVLFESSTIYPPVARNAMTIEENVVFVVFTVCICVTRRIQSHQGKHFLYNYFLVEQFTLDYRFVWALTIFYWLSEEAVFPSFFISFLIVYIQHSHKQASNDLHDWFNMIL